MREILFRGKRVDNNEWVYGYYLELWRLQIGLDFEGFTGISYILVVHDHILKVTEFYEVKPDSVCQFTGLLDKKERKIFEGDIVIKNEYIWIDKSIENYRGKIEWLYSQWQVIAHCVNPHLQGISDGINYALNDDGFEDEDITDWKILGNVHDNPELLKKGGA